MQFVDLRAEVEAAVKPYASDTIIPPFSVAQIMVMAWVCRKNPGYGVSDEEISDWIFLTFGYYRKVALKELHQHGFQECAISYKHRNAFHDFVYQRALQLERLEVPLRRFTTHRGTAFTSTGASSRRFLRRALASKPPSFTRFLELPAELRMTIYEEVFRPSVGSRPKLEATVLEYSDDEFHPDSKSRRLRLSLQGMRPKRAYERTIVRLNQEIRRGSIQAWATEPTSEVMALLCVNRQIYEEAMPVFYKVNPLHADNLNELAKLLLHCGTRRRTYFTDISFNFNARVGMKTINIALGLLKDIKCLRRLKISADDDDFLKGPEAYKSARYDSVAEIPGMKLLSKVRCRELVFCFSNTKIESYLRPRIMRTGRISEMKEETKSAKPSREDAKKAS